VPPLEKTSEFNTGLRRSIVTPSLAHDKNVALPVNFVKFKKTKTNKKKKKITGIYVHVNRMHVLNETPRLYYNMCVRRII